MVSDEMDGDLILLIDSYIPDALKTACKLVAQHKPIGHEKLLKDHTQIAAFTNDGEFLRFAIHSIIVQTDRFHTISGSYLGTEFDLEPVFSKRALRTSTVHGENYYFVDDNSVYISRSDGSVNLSTIDIRHYYYATTSEYPDELSDILIEELTKRVQTHLTKKALEAKQNAIQSDSVRPKRD